MKKKLLTITAATFSLLVHTSAVARDHILQATTADQQFNQRLKEAQEQVYEWKYFDNGFYRINLKTAKQFKKGVYWAQLESKSLGDRYSPIDFWGKGVVADCNQVKISMYVKERDLFNGKWRSQVTVPKEQDTAQIQMLRYFCVERK